MTKKLFNTIYLTRCTQAMSQETLAKRVGISRQTLSAIEQGKQNPSLVTALLIAQTLQSSLEDLFSLERIIHRKRTNV